MKRAQMSTVIIVTALFSAYSEASDCTAPTAPKIPDGQNASEDKMLAAQADVKDFIADGRQYLGCVKDREAELAKQASADERQAVVDRYNTMVDQMKAASRDFNQAVTDYQSTLQPTK